MQARAAKYEASFVNRNFRLQDDPPSDFLKARKRASKSRAFSHRLSARRVTIDFKTSIERPKRRREIAPGGKRTGMLCCALRMCIEIILVTYNLIS